MDETLLIGMGAPLYRDAAGGLMIERQTVSGLHAWQANFARVIAYAILKAGPPPAGWIPAADHLPAPAFELIALPDTYHRPTWRRERAAVRRVLHDAMNRATYRVFSYGGWPTDPGEIAAGIARRHGIPHAVWLDRVESQAAKLSDGSAKGRLKAAIRSRIIRRTENRAVRRADLAMLHGTAVYQHFRHMARNAEMADNIHVRDEDRIAPDAAEAKARDCANGPLRIVYCGRANASKGCVAWMTAVGRLHARGVNFTATWVGDGEEMPVMRRMADDLGLPTGRLHFTGFLDDAAAVRRHYRDGHVLMFCHVTDESPRNLIESLHSATPLVGFGDAFSRALVDEQGGGRLVGRGDVDALVDTVAGLAADRATLPDLIRAAGRSAAHLTRDRVFAQRAAQVRTHLAPG